MMRRCLVWGAVVSAVLLIGSATPGAATTVGNPPPRPRPRPQAEVVRVTANPTTIVVGDAYRANVKVANTHKRPSAPGSVLIFFGGARAASKAFPSVPGDSSLRVKLDLLVPAGTPAGPVVLAACRATPGRAAGCADHRVTTTLLIEAPAHLKITPTSRDFGDAPILTPPSGPSQSFLVQNDGGVPTGLISTSLTGTDTSQFDKAADSCDGPGGPVSLNPSDACTAVVLFEPTSTGEKSAMLHISATPGGTIDAPLSGNGQTPPQLQTAITDTSSSPLASDYQSSATRDVGALLIGNVGYVRVWIRNNGQTDATIGNNPVPIDKSPSGAGAPHAVITGAGTDTTCNVPANNNDASSVNFNNLVIAAGSACFIKIGITPEASGAASLSFSIQESLTGTSISDTIQATGQAPAHLTLSPTSLDFGNVLHGTSSASKRITVTNDGDVSANSLTVVTDGSPSGRFTSTNDCPASLGAGASCHVDTTYSPGASDTGNETGSVTVNFSGGNNPSASLSGNAVATAANLQISITPNSSTSPGTYGNSDSANVGSGFVAHSGSTVKVWIKNTGAADAYISNSPVPVTLGTNSELQVFGPPSSTCDVANAVPTTTITFNDLKIAGGAECYIAMRAEPTVDNAAFSASFTITGTPGGSITGSISGN